MTQKWWILVPVLWSGCGIYAGYQKFHEIQDIHVAELLLIPAAAAAGPTLLIRERWLDKVLVRKAGEVTEESNQ